MFTTPEFPDRVFSSLEELETLQKERDALRQSLQEEVVTTKAEAADEDD